MTEQERVCQRLKVEYQLFDLKTFGAKWCEIPEQDIPYIISTAQRRTARSVGDVIISSRDYPCLETKMRFIVESIENGNLIPCDESGNERIKSDGKSDYIKWGRCHVSGKRAREFMIKYCHYHGDTFPKFLFPDVSNQYSIHDAMTKIKNLENENRELQNKIKILEKNKSYLSGIPKKIEEMRKEKMTERQIASSLWGNNKGLSYAQIGVLLHTTGDISASSLKDYASDLINGMVKDFLFIDRIK